MSLPGKAMQLLVIGSRGSLRCALDKPRAHGRLQEFGHDGRLQIELVQKPLPTMSRFIKPPLK